MKIVTDSANYTAIASAIRAKKKSTGALLPAEMAAAISGIETGAGLNIDYGASEPLDTSKLWVPRGGNAPASVSITDESDVISDSLSPYLSFTGAYAVNASAVEIGGRIYVTGCSAVPTHASNVSIRVLDPGAGTFTELSGAQTVRSAAAAASAAVGNVIYTVGGSNYKDYMGSGAEFYDTVIKYDITSKTGGTMNSRLPFAMAKTTAVACGGNIFVMGGIKKNGDTYENVSAVYKIDVSADTVSEAGSGINGFAPECCALVGGKVYCFGTSTPQPDKSAAVSAAWVYDIQSGKSTLLDCDCPDFYGSCCCTLGGRVYIFCRDGNVYNLDGCRVVQCPAVMDTPAEGACCAAVGDSIYIIGGYAPYAAHGSFWTSPYRNVRVYTAAAKLSANMMKVAVGGAGRSVTIIKSDSCSIRVPIADVRIGSSDGTSVSIPAYVYTDGGWRSVR